MKKKMLSVIVCIAMILTMLPVTVFAADGAASSITVSVPEGRTISSVQEGDEITVELSNADFVSDVMLLRVYFDSTLFRLDSFEGTNSKNTSVIRLFCEDDEGYVSSSAKSTVDNANSNGYFGVQWGRDADYSYRAGAIATLRFTAIGTGSGDFSLYEDRHVLNGNSYKDTVSTTSVTVVKTPIAAASATIAAPTKGQAFPSTVAAGATSYTASVAWFTDEACTKAAGDTVRGGQTYYAKITLTPDTANGESFADSVSVTVGENNYTCARDTDGSVAAVVSFTTEARVLDGITVTTAPTNTAYKVGDTFDASGMAVTATYDDGTNQTVTGYTWSPNGALAATNTDITVSYEGKTTTQTITVTKYNATLTYESDSVTYDGTDHASTVANSIQGFQEGLMGSLSVFFKLNDSVVDQLIDAGTYKVYASTQEGTKYNALGDTELGTFTINKADASVATAPAAAENLTYTGSEQALVTAGTASGGTMQYSLDGTNYSAKVPAATDAGDYTVYYKVVGDQNHNNVAAASIPVTIARKAVTVTADDASKVYGAADPALAATVSGTVGSDKVTYTLSRTDGEDVNTYDITASGETVQGNYTVTYAKGTFTISKAASAVTDAPTANTLTYTGSAQALVTEGTATGGTMQYSLDGKSYSATVPTGTDAVAYTVYYKVAGDANHSDTEPVPVPVTIARKAVTVTANNASKVYNAADPTLSATVSGTVGSDKVTYTLSRTAGEDVNTYAITASGDATQGNYTVSYVNGTFTITQAENSITGLTISGWTYGDKANAPSASAAFGTVAYTYSSSQSGTFSEKVPTDAGTWYVKAAVAGTTNYKGAEAVMPFTIAQREVTLTWGESSFTYDGQPHAPTATAGNLKSGDTVTVTVNGEQTDAGDNYTATASISNSNYKLPEAATCTFSIAKAAIAQAQLSGSMTVRSHSAKAVTFTLPALPEGASYGDPTVYANDDGLIDTAVPTVSGTTLSFSVTSQVKDKTATINVPVNGGKNYSDATYTLTVTSVDKDDAGVTVTADSSTVTYGDSLTVSGSANPQAGSGTWSWNSSNSAVVAVSGKGASPTVTIKGVGTATITGTFENDDYLGTATATVTVTQREVTLNWGASIFTYDGQSHVPAVTLGNVKTGDTVNVTVTGEQTNAGTNYTATAESLDNGNYKLPEAKTRSFTINKADAAVTDAPTAQKLTYSGSAQALVSAGEATGGTVQYSLNGTNYSTTIPTGTDAGSYTVYYKVVGDENHNDTARASVTVAIAKAYAAYTAPAAKTGLTYNGQAQALVDAGSTNDGTMQYRLGNGTWGTTVPTATNAGSYTVYYKVVGDKNHKDVTEKNVSVAIARKAVTVTADNATKVYGAADPGSFTATVSGTVGNDKVKYTLSRAAGENVGAYDITASGNAIQSNYDVTFEKGTFTITKATNAVSNLTISGWTYGDKANAPSAKATFGTVAYSYGSAQDGPFTATVPVNAGTWYVKAAVAGTDNYDGAQAVTSFTIARKAVTITANNATKVYGESDPTLTVTVTGVVSGDDIPASALRAVGNNVNTYTISVNVSTQGNYLPDNYTITTVPGTFTITPKAVTVKADDAEKTYGQDDPKTFIATVTGVVDDYVITYDVTRQQGENAGQYTITASGAATQGNYTVTYVAGKFTVKPLTGEEVVAGEGVSQMEDSQTKDFTEDLAKVEQFTDEAVGIQAGDSDAVKQEKREAAVKDAMVSAAKLSNANTSGLYFVSANSAAASQIVLAVPNGAANSSRFNYKVMYMAADGTVTEVPSQVTANGIVADLAQGADGVYMVAYTPKPVHVVDDGASASGGQSIITDLTDINKVTVDGKTVDPKYYTVSGGVVTLSEAYLRTLSNGKHTVRVENAKYISTAVITVSNSTVKSAGTGDAGLGLYAMLALSSVTGAAWLGLKKRKED